MLIAEDFGYGSAGKLASITEVLDERVVLVGSLHAEKVVPSHRVIDSHPHARDASAISDVAQRYGVEIALVSNTHPLSREVHRAGLQTIFVDSLPFLWTDKDPVYHDPDIYCAQVAGSIPALSWRSLRRVTNLVWVEAIVDTRPTAKQIRSDLALVNFGGVATHLLQLQASAYPPTVLRAALDALRRAGFARVVVTGNLYKRQLAAVAGDFPELTVMLEEVDHSRMTDLLGTCRVLLTSPGLTTILEAGAAQTPTILLPPQNVSQFMNADMVRRCGGERSVVDWPQSVVSRDELDEVRGEGEDEAVSFVYRRISEAGAGAYPDICEMIRSALDLPEGDLFGSARYVELIGRRGAEQIVDYVRQLQAGVSVADVVAATRRLVDTALTYA
jgi:hydroxymethylcytosylglucuronate/cytosylglucuronate synthase